MVDWIAAVAASIAALASVAVLWRQHTTVDWEIKATSDRAAARDQVINVGNGTARNVLLRVGSASDPTDSDKQEVRRRTVRRGEAIPFSNFASYGSPDDYSVNITWRGFPRRNSWSRPLF